MKTNNIKLKLTQLEHGWFYLNLTSDLEDVTLIASDTYNSPYYFIKAVNNLYLDNISEKILWEAEIDLSYLILERKDNLVEIKVEYDSKDDFFISDKGATRKTIIVFNQLCELKNLVKETEKLFENILSVYSKEEYKNNWGHDFPEEEYNKIKNIVNNLLSD